MILKNRVGENEKQSHEVQQNEILDTASRMLSDYASAVIAATFIRYWIGELLSSHEQTDAWLCPIFPVIDSLHDLGHTQIGAVGNNPEEF